MSHSDLTALVDALVPLRPGIGPLGTIAAWMTEVANMKRAN